MSDNWCDESLEDAVAFATKFLHEEGVEALCKFALINEQASGHKPQWYRGQSRLSWELVPKAYRKVRDWQGKFVELSAEDKLLYERGQFFDFRRQAPMRSHKELYPDDDWPAWLYLMQHYGVATRLLDWSESMLIAAYFAVENEDDWGEDGVIYSLAQSRLNFYASGEEVCGDDRDEVTLKVLTQGIGEIQPFAAVPMPKCPVAFRPRQVDTRMVMQQAAFTAHFPEQPSLSRLPFARTILNRLVIPAACKGELKARLRILGMTAITVFPDLEHLGRQISSARFVRSERPV